MTLVLKVTLSRWIASFAMVPVTGRALEGSTRRHANRPSYRTDDELAHATRRFFAFSVASAFSKVGSSSRQGSKGVRCLPEERRWGRQGIVLLMHGRTLPKGDLLPPDP